MSASSGLLLRNGQAASLRELPLLPLAELRHFVVEGREGGAEIAALFAQKQGGSAHRLVVALADATSGLLRLACAAVGTRYPCLTSLCPAAHWFERELAEEEGLQPEGHPWLKRIRFSSPEGGQCGEAPFFQVEGEEVHEVAVGPVHAGVIEPGHFRFQCHGETVLHLEISLGYQHRGARALLERGADGAAVHVAETIAGDSSVAHATAYCEVLEALGGRQAPPRAQALRAVALELERIANHIGDLGALAGDVGFLPTAAWCGRIRGEVLNLTALYCGNRFGRSLIRPGGVAWDLDGAMAGELAERLQAVERDVRGACGLLWRTPSVLARFDGTGPVSRETALEVGLTGPAARACGVDRDVRRDQPSGIWRFSHIPVSTASSGDVLARVQVRWMEIERSFAFLYEQLRTLPAGECRLSVPPPRGGAIALSLVEGWRGQVCHVASSGQRRGGGFARYQVVDPSFRNWFGLALAMRGQPISDFPLCNKSFNLSYCGHDL